LEPIFCYPENVIHLSSADWRKDFLRFNKSLTVFYPDNPKVNYEPRVGKQFVHANYLLNQRDALEAFYRWFVDLSSSNYLDMLMRQHSISCLGECGNRTYTKTFSETKHELCIELFAGQLRSELDDKGIQHPFIDYIPTSDLNPKFSIKTNEGVAIKFVPKIHWPTLTQPSKGYIRREAPQSDSFVEFQEAASKAMNKIKVLCDHIEVTNPSTLLLLLTSLSDYYHLAINWMPFSQVNNSLFMGQINVILRHCNLQSTPHGYLDLHALTQPYNEFRKIFTDTILRLQILRR
jgi:hypothetical protein